jgi:hypothetical protein
LLPVYNAGQYLSEAIESILAQTFTRFELIIINDASTDNSLDIIKSFNDSRIVYLENPVNLKIVATLNKGIALARGKYIARMDADDISMPARLQMQYDYLEKHPETGVCGTYATVIDENGRETGKLIHQTDSEFIDINLLFSVPLIHPSVMIGTELLRSHLYCDKPYAEDYDLWCRLSCSARIVNLPKYLLLYRIHSANVSKVYSGQQLRCKESIVRQQLQRMHLQADNRQLHIHSLSFMPAFGNQVGKAELEETCAWFKKLIENNRATGLYPHHKLLAFLWGRWSVLCIRAKQKRKILLPPFMRVSPCTVCCFWGQMRLLLAKYRAERQEK